MSISLRPRRPVARRTVLGLAVLFALLAACGDDGPEDAGSGDSGATTAGTELSPELSGVVEDARRLAPALESALRGTDYPTDLDAALAALADADLEPSDGNTVAGYAYDPETVEFVLCIEGPSGSFASYDTRPMSLFTTGESGGCPA